MPYGFAILSLFFFFLFLLLLLLLLLLVFVFLLKTSHSFSTFPLFELHQRTADIHSLIDSC